MAQIPISNRKRRNNYHLIAFLSDKSSLQKMTIFPYQYCYNYSLSPFFKCKDNKSLVFYATNLTFMYFFNHFMLSI